MDTLLKDEARFVRLLEPIIDRAVGRAVDKAVGPAVDKAVNQAVGPAVNTVVGPAVDKAVRHAFAYTVTPMVDRVVGDAVGGLRAEMNDRFEAVDKRFAVIDGRFDDVDQQLQALREGQDRFAIGLEQIQKVVFDHMVDTDRKLRRLQQPPRPTAA